MRVVPLKTESDSFAVIRVEPRSLCFVSVKRDGAFLLVSFREGIKMSFLKEEIRVIHVPSAPMTESNNVMLSRVMSD